MGFEVSVVPVYSGSSWEEILPGIAYRSFPSEIFKNEMTSMNLYAVFDDKQVLFVDAGMDGEIDASVFEDLLSQKGLTFQDASLFITHVHIDHIGAVAELEKLGVTILGGPIDEHYTVQDLENYLHLSGGLREGIDLKELIWAFCFLESPKFTSELAEQSGIDPVLFLANTTRLDYGSVLEIGDYRFEVVKLNGHSLDQCGLYDRDKKILFAGDEVIAEHAPRVCTYGLDEHILAQYYDHLDWIEQADLTWVFTAHSGPLKGKEKIVPALQQEREDYQKRSRSILKLLQEQVVPMTACQVSIARSVPANMEHMHARFSHDGTIYELKSVKVLACLENLYDNGLVERSVDSDGTAWYSIKVDRQTSNNE